MFSENSLRQHDSLRYPKRDARIHFIHIEALVRIPKFLKISMDAHAGLERASQCGKDLFAVA